MSSRDYFVVQGIIKKKMPGGKFLVSVETEKGDVDIITHVSGKIRERKINISTGDVVDIGISQYDASKGRILYRN